MTDGYFWNMGRCDHCGWPHHLRFDRPARSRRWWRKAQEARSWVVCANCEHVTDLTERNDR